MPFTRRPSSASSGSRFSACAAFFFVSSPALTLATEYYVATNGSDRNAGTEALPFASIRQAASVSAPGDTVFIRGGTYTQGVTISRPGTAEAWITFAAYPGEVPVLDGGGGGGTGVNIEASFIRVRGLVSQNWSSSGFANGWDISPGNVAFENLIAENNGINGIAFYKNTGVRIEGCIVAHNGNREPSWSSGVNVFQVGGTHEDNVVQGNVSFENIDISSNHTDGNGFILDEGSSGASFVNNIGFRNGGSCIRLTNSSGSHLINNTCFHNGLDPNNTPTFVADEIFFSDARTRTDTVVRNNLAVAVNGKGGLSHESGTGLSVFENNLVVDDGGPSPFFVSSAGALDLRVLEGSAQIIDQGSLTEAPEHDIGFDFRCVRAAAGQPVSFWQYAPDYDFIRSIGGVAACFSPSPRPLAQAPDLGAYEFGVPPAACTLSDCAGNAACADDPVCADTPDPGEPTPSGATPSGSEPNTGIGVEVPNDDSTPLPSGNVDMGDVPGEVPTFVAPSSTSPRAQAGGCAVTNAPPRSFGGGGLVWVLLGALLAGSRVRRSRGFAEPPQ